VPDTDPAARARRAIRWLQPFALLAAGLALAACGAGQRGAGPAPLAAAEPAVAPPPVLHPAGPSIPVGAFPEGIVVDPRTGIVVVAVRDPAQLVLLSARTGRVLRRVPILAPPRHLELVPGGLTVLVPAEPIDRLLELSLPGGRVRSVAVGAHPHDAAAAAGRVLVGNEFGHSVSVIRGARTIARIGGFLQPGGLAAVGRDVAVVDVGADTVTLIDAASFRVLGSAHAGQGPTHLVSDGERLFVVDTRGGAVLVYATRPALRLVSRFSLPGTPYGVAIDPLRRRLWVTLTAKDALAELAIDGPSLRALDSYPTARQPNTVAVDPRDGRVFVADAGPGAVQLIDPRR
jgi:DNA-binding beta-propeller fold protein YncE